MPKSSMPRGVGCELGENEVAIDPVHYVPPDVTLEIGNKKIVPGTGRFVVALEVPGERTTKIHRYLTAQRARLVAQLLNEQLLAEDPTGRRKRGFYYVHAERVSWFANRQSKIGSDDDE